MQRIICVNECVGICENVHKCLYICLDFCNCTSVYIVNVSLVPLVFIYLLCTLFSFVVYILRFLNLFLFSL